MRHAVEKNPIMTVSPQTLVCSEFENRLREGGEPRIEDYVGNETDSMLVSRLLMIELRYRYLRGEEPGLSEYAGRFPEVSGLVNRISRFSQQLKRDIHRARQSAEKADSESRQIDQYDLLSEIKSTTAGVVWRGWDRIEKRPVAVRLIPASTDARKSEVISEYEAARGSCHPNVLQVYDIHARENDVVVVTEYVDGVSLKSVVRQGAFEANQAARLAGQIAEGISYLHERGFAFYRVSSGNVQIDVRGRIKLIHLASLTRLINRSANPPEHVRPIESVREKDEYRRLFSANLVGLAVILHEMLTGCVADGVLETEVAAGRRATSLRPPRSIKRDIPADVAAICMKGLRGPFDGGYSTAEVFADDLRRFCGRLPVSARKTSLLGRLWQQMVLCPQ